LQQTSYIRKTIKKLTLNKKGFSSIVGAIFAIITILFITSATFIWSTNQNTMYNNTVRQVAQSDIDRLNEKVAANVTATSYNSTAVAIRGILQNSGPLPVTINTAWVVDSSDTSVFGSSNTLGLNLKPGNITTLNGITTVYVNLPPHDILDTYTCWFITSRGNSVTQYSLIQATGETNVNVNVTNNIAGGNTLYSNVSQGIGLIGFDFKGFSKAQKATDFIDNTEPLTFTSDYSLKENDYVIFHATLTNYDPGHSDYIINGTSSAYMLFSQFGTVKFTSFRLINVTNVGGNLYINKAITNPMVTLVFEQPTDVYFYGRVDNNIAPLGVYPLNIMVMGTLESVDYSQNVPFVSLNVVG
jgi:hypothetical protein